MPVNQAQIASLGERPVPPDRECVTNLTEIVRGVVDFCPVVGLASQIPSPTGVSVPVTNNTGQQALTLAQKLEEMVKELQAEQAQKRIVVTDVQLPTGNSEIPYTFTPEMPTTNYEIRAYFTRPVAHVTVPKWGLVSGTKTTSGFTLILDDIPAACLITVVVEELKPVT